MYSHGAVAAKYFGKEAVEAAFADYETAPGLTEEVRATLGMLHALTLHPQSFGVAHIRPLLALGLTPAAIEHAILVGGFLFNMHNRALDAFGCDIPEDKAGRAAMALDRVGRKPLKNDRDDGQAMVYAGAIPAPVQALIEAIVSGPGASDPALREAMMEQAAQWSGATREAKPMPALLISYAETIARDAVEVTDEMIAALKQSAYTEHEIFEFTIAASAGAGIARLEIGWSALAGALAGSPEAV